MHLDADDQAASGAEQRRIRLAVGGRAKTGSSIGTTVEPASSRFLADRSGWKPSLNFLLKINKLFFDSLSVAQDALQVQDASHRSMSPS